ncbi:ABC transporter ATP-binding protein [Lacticaseibacillus yichunensis]|uniref:ABC transporter ATP-binding protein n=1 Tax=Lacticaseibacillus yichunensis TaxID=2486015 RepID=A0ABW4CNU3_9LACO|nr:ATP-binding cassette domain-containing protein [Lacticaseibacillus yichunensis]
MQQANNEEAAQLQLNQVAVNVVVGQSVRPLLQNIDLTVQPGEFVTVLGANGAGKSTLFNAITGDVPLAGGTITLAGHDISAAKRERRAHLIARVFQDPKMGTAPRMTVAENLALASRRGQRLTLASRQLKAQLSAFEKLAAQTGNGLEKALNKPTEELSGGQRQALSLLMATMRRPELLLLDEHTAALDPHTSEAIMTLTQQIVAREQLTCLMITHQLEDALTYGSRLIVLQAGHIVADYSGEAKAQLTRADLLQYFG